MVADAEAMFRSLLPTYPKLSAMLCAVGKDVFKARYLPRKLVQFMVKKAFDDMRRDGQEIMEDPIFKERLEQYARQIYGRFMNEIAQMNHNRSKHRV